MIRRSAKQNGFAGSVLIPILAIMLIVGFLGYRFMSHNSTATAEPVPGSLYSYDMTAAISNGQLINNAATNGSTPLKFVGNWSSTSTGVRFEGDKSSKMSVAYAKPDSGNVLSVPAGQALGSVAKIRFEGPAAGQGCLGDSRNIFQIGRFASGAAQMKIQLSNCTVSKTHIYPQCRVAGSKSASKVPIIRSSQALTGGSEYVIRCIQSYDTGSYKTNVRMDVITIGSNGEQQLVTNNLMIPNIGDMTTTSALSIANKYPLPSQTANTDQFTGDVAKVAYCGGATLSDVLTCLTAEVPDTIPTPPVGEEPVDPEVPTDPEVPVEPTTTQFVTNQSFESDLTGWTGIINSNSKSSRVSGGYDGVYSIRSTNSSSSTSKHGFISKPHWIDGSTNATVESKVYTASGWVKPDSTGQVITINVRELSPSGSQVSAKAENVTTNSTEWQKITNLYTARATGNTLVFQVFATSQGSRGFSADSLSLTTQ